MKIKSISIKNYKRFHDLTIDLGENPKRIIALVGPNGCGKSSVFDALLYHSNAFGPIGSTRSKNYLYHSLNQEPNYSYQNITINFENENFYELRKRLTQTGEEKTIFSFRSPYRYNSNLKVTQSQAVAEIRLNSNGASDASSIDQKMEDNYRRLTIKYNNYLKTQDCRPSEAKRHIIGELNDSINNCLSLQIVDLGDIEDGKGTMYFQKVDYTIPFEFDVLSSGEKEVVDLLLDLYLRKDTYSNSIFIIDEPELHLNTSIQKKLLIEINKLIGANCQLWIATHSIGFLRALQEDFNEQSQIIEFNAENSWATTTYILSPIVKSRSNWKLLFSTALDDLTNLVSPKKLIYCEGIADPGRGGVELGFDANIYNKIFEEKYPETLFISSGGNTEPDQRSEIALAILSKVFTGIEILVLKDRDVSSGRFTTENDRLVYLRNNPKNHRMLDRMEIENYLFDKEILIKYCQTNYLSFDEVSYNAFVTNIKDQNLKDETGRIKNICGINTSISKDVFKQNLSKLITPDTNVYQQLEKDIFMI